MKVDRPVSRLNDGLMLIAIFLAVVLPRLLVVSQTATSDETKWVARAANFSTALSSGDLSKSFQSEHPGVTTMWAGALGLKALFPDFTAQDPGQLKPYELDGVLRSNGYTPLQALVAGRQVMVLLNGLVLVLIFIYARRLLDLQTALLALLLSALSPFFIALTQLLHLDGLEGSLMLLSFIAFLGYANRQKKLDLLISGVAAGFAWLTKTPAFLLAPIMLIVTLLAIWTGRENGHLKWAAVRSLLLSLLAWALIGWLIFVLFWPAMWVNPLETLQSIFGSALDQAGGGHSEPLFFNGTIYRNGLIPTKVLYFYPLNYIWRVTPVVLIGLVLVIPALWQRWSPLDRSTARSTVLQLLLYTLLFALFMSLGGKKSDRYLIPIYPALHLVSAAGWVALLRMLFSRSVAILPRKSSFLVLLLVGFLAAWQFFALRSSLPYPLSYYNPLLGGAKGATQVLQVGWGEGLDAAGRYLAEKPQSDKLTIASWYRSALAYYFDGHTISIYTSPSQEQAEAINAADYAVLYINQRQREIPPALLSQFEALVPEHIIEINGLEYVWIYDLRQLRDENMPD